MHLRSHNLLQKTAQIVPKQRQSVATKAKQVAAVKSPLKRSQPVSDVKQEILSHMMTPIKLENDVKAEISSELSATPAKRAKREPENWKLIWDKIKTMRGEHPAAVDSEGCETFNDLTLDPPVRRFHVLVACMLSSQTKDPVTAAAMGRLRAHGTPILCLLWGFIFQQV
ncbi:Endonuclease III-like protein 1 [Aphanomyces cochlioides]|nr:Endonuclease III-like protein 1 [Aphanomyces cochlioides]